MLKWPVICTDAIHLHNILWQRSFNGTIDTWWSGATSIESLRPNTKYIGVYVPSYTPVTLYLLSLLFNIRYLNCIKSSNLFYPLKSCPAEFILGIAFAFPILSQNWNCKGFFKNAYELFNLRALKLSLVDEIHIFQCMGISNQEPGKLQPNHHIKWWLPNLPTHTCINWYKWVDVLFGFWIYYLIFDNGSIWYVFTVCKIVTILCGIKLTRMRKCTNIFISRRWLAFCRCYVHFNQSIVWYSMWTL